MKIQIFVIFLGFMNNALKILMKNVSDLMRQENMGQIDLARALGKTPSSINRFFTEHRPSNPSLEMIGLWAEILKTTPGWLLTDHSVSPSLLLPKSTEAILLRVENPAQWNQVDRLLEALMQNFADDKADDESESDSSESAAG